jgi:hypothetical protein
MTLLAKILIFLNLLLSVLMLAWALALFTNRVDWSNNQAKGQQPAGALLGRVKRKDDAQAMLDLAAGHWREALRGNDGKDKRPAHDGLPAWEARRAADRVWYADQLKLARSTPNTPDGKPVVIKRVSLSKEGQAVLDANNSNRPMMVDATRRKDDKGEGGGPLYSYEYYVAELVRLTQQLEAAQVEYQKAVKRETELTEEAIGTKEKPKGLRQRIIDEEEKLKQAKEERKDVADRQTNSEVDAELLVARREQLKRRIAELEKAAQGTKD